jgi:predicted chitinase
VGKTKKKVKNGLGGGADTAELFTIEQLTEISQNQDPVANDLAGDVAALIPEMKKGGIVTKNQITAFLANVCQETDHLNTLEEYGDEAYYRSFLGDEWWYHGRGYIMNPWLDAYQRLSSVLGVDLVSNPDLLAQDKKLAAKAAVWYWNMRDCGPVADRGDFEGVCSLINRGELVPQGPIHGWENRLAAYERAQSVIGTGTEPVTQSVTEIAIGRSESVADQISLVYDREGWAYDTASRLYVRSNTADLDHKTNKDGWLWAKVETVVPTPVEPTPVEPTPVEPTPVEPAPPTWSWPEAWYQPGYIGDGSYVDTHPERYSWRSDVEEVARYLVDTYGVWCNTYVDHPPGWGLDNVSMDVWAYSGRGSTVDPSVGQAVFDDIFNNGKQPWIWWVIWWGSMWSMGGGWEAAPWGPVDSDPGHYSHVHFTFV